MRGTTFPSASTQTQTETKLAVLPSTPTQPAHGFGSFHTERADERVEVLIAKSDAEYKPPSMPIDVSIDHYPIPVPSSSIKVKHRTTGELMRTVLYGADTKKELFFLDPEFCFLNHGAFGATLRPVQEIAHRWQMRMESQPLRFIDRELLPLLVYVTRQVAAFVNAPAQNVVLLSNVTTGLNSIIRSFPLKPGDRMMSLSLGYGSTKKMLKFHAQESGAEHDELEITLPILSRLQIIGQVKRYFKKHTIPSNNPNEPAKCAVKFVVFDHINSNSAIMLPIKELVQICHDYGAAVLVDGAHALGSISIDIEDLKPDFYLSNAHKWLCSAKGAAFMYVSPKYQSSVVPAIISHGYGSGFTSHFLWAGLQDYGPWLSLATAIEFWRQCGTFRTFSAIRSLAHEAAELLCQEWNTEPLAPLSEDLFGTMVTVRVPGSRRPKHGDESNEIQDRLYYEYKIECPVKHLDGRLYVRISAHVYNHIDEYKRLAEAMLKIRPRLEPGSAEDKADLEAELTSEKICAVGGCG